MDTAIEQMGANILPLGVFFFLFVCGEASIVVVPEVQEPSLVRVCHPEEMGMVRVRFLGNA